MVLWWVSGKCLVARSFASWSQVQVSTTPACSPARAVPSIGQGRRGRSHPALPGFARAPCASPSAPPPQPPAPQPPPTFTQRFPPPAPPPPTSPTHQPSPAPSPARPQHCLFTRSLCNFLPSCTGGSSCGWDSLDAERPPQMGGSRYTARRHTTHPHHTPTPRPYSPTTML